MLTWNVFADRLGRTEGPVFTSDGRIALVSMASGCVHFLDRSGNLLDTISTGAGPNGLTEGADGCFYVAQNGGRYKSNQVEGVPGGVQVIGRDRRVRWVSQDPISPCDICLGPDGWLYVTDPTAREARNDARIWRCHPDTESAELITSCGWFPNGLGFDANDRLYFADTGNSRIMCLDFNDDGTTSESVFCDLNSGGPDGFAFDAAGQMIVACIGLGPDDTGHLEVVSPAGEVLRQIEVGSNRLYTNVAIDSDGLLLVTDTDGGQVLSTQWEHPGLPLHPFR